MSAKIRLEETDTGWRLLVRDAEAVYIETDGSRISINLQPDDDDAPTPLDVQLG